MKFLNTKTLAYLGILLAGLSVFYALVIAPEFADRRIERCLDRVYESARETWKNYCGILGLTLGEDGLCLLPSEQSDKVEKEHGYSRDRCIERYKR
ncbi:MAG: hypothetical protein A3A80_02965 [Candidatus Terrybacteria bacterium RIFCSPLOWO2_01_FULL_44_24]|uniref:Uncharacterized protein n=1 Tax=Candidatus Terrybacteria bacterium RIFCSPHIGHO2_01_FULL_43_35 TaxID=1802361 RepID=A0A1G2PEX6_9BACT|nr:MAG: hypothetical protein A2828_03150 [Candidatus Terrybacteria bacterium RIFCSPHIGHO2_01_FULL_43_35]OHA51025.1 MAG: hypothetical protein A3A80_02965 [Candidatus Terrybacteria bacterium RIFCSPLOWO2_01_FULL_44_24]